LLGLLLFALPVAAAPVVLVYGDSISAAYGLRPEQGWVRLLEQRLRAGGYDYTVANASISGETTLGGKNRIAGALQHFKPAVVIVELGGNDGLRGLSLDDTRANLTAITRAARAAGAQVLLLGMELPPNYGKPYTEKFQALYRAVAKQERVPLVPFLFTGFADRRDAFQPDGIHPAADVQGQMLDNVWPQLRPLLRAPAKLP
jgi:acyl-CoA thioesterase-1